MFEGIIMRWMGVSKKYRISSGDFNLLFNTLFAPLSLFANKFVNDIEVSKDIVQEVFVQVWNKKIEFSDELVVKSYLYSSVKNKSLDYLKSKHFKVKSDIKIEELKKVEANSFFLREVMLSETYEIIAAALERLPLKSKEVTKLSVLGLSNQQIAEELLISVNTVKTQKRIAYQKLRTILKKDYLQILAYFLV